MLTTRVAVLRGGPSSEYDVSLNTGANVLKALAPIYKVKDVLVTKNSEWYMDGVKVNPEIVCRGVDVVFIAMHGEFGEDGQVQKILDRFKVPYTGSRSWPSKVAMNKALTKDYFRKNAIRTPHGLLVHSSGESVEELTSKIFNKVSPPWFVKPNIGGSSVGASLCKNIPELIVGLNQAFKYCESVIVEECIKGREATCGIIENFRDTRRYALFPIEIIKPDNRSFFDYQCKYDGTTKEICPGNFSKEEKDEMQRMAVKIHKAIGLRHYSRSDFIVSPRGIYALEVNTLPGLTSESLFPKAMAAVGCGYASFLEHLINLALADK
ncbi:MAG: D-alanine--D-alanine ligase [Candidatus Vogelbacteria bacterium]|nr:D-alanine--D-alanine ligase [Candidatus Vogelbacteria bacterium]